MKIKFGKKKKDNKINRILYLSVMICCLWRSSVADASQVTNAPVLMDNFTGEAIIGVQTEKNEIPVYDACIYEVSTKKFLYIVDETENLQVKSSVADGMITNDSVTLEVSKEQEFVLYKDGTPVEDGNFSSIKQAGSYLLEYQGKKVLEFRIVGAYSNLEIFYAPKGFYIKDALLDGVAAQYGYESVELTGEGNYEVQYVCESTGQEYSFQTIIDKTAPVLTLKEVNEKGRASGPVDISDREADSTLKIVLEGKEQKVTDTLTKSGKYMVTIFDQAGNYNTYEFTILLYFNISSVTFFLLIFVVVGGILAYIMISSRRLRVF